MQPKGLAHLDRQAARERAHARPGSVFSYPNRGKTKQVAIRKRVLNTIKSTWGGRRYSSGSALPVERQDPDRHVDVPGLGDRPGALQGAQARGECPDPRRQGPQQAPPAVEVAAQAPAPLAVPHGAPGDGQPVELRPALPGLLSWPRRHSPLEVLPVLQRRRLPRAHDHRAELDEPDADGLQGPVEPCDDHLAARRAPGVQPDLRRVAARPTGLQDLPPVRRRQGAEHLLPPPRHLLALRPGDAGAAEGAVHGARRRVATGDTAPRSGSSSTRSTTAAEPGSPSGSSGCGTRVATSRSSTR